MFKRSPLWLPTKQTEETKGFFFASIRACTDSQVWRWMLDVSFTLPDHSKLHRADSL